MTGMAAALRAAGLVSLQAAGEAERAAEQAWRRALPTPPPRKKKVSLSERLFLLRKNDEPTDFGQGTSAETESEIKERLGNLKEPIPEED